MVLDLARFASFLACILLLMNAATHAFFVPGLQWQERLLLIAARLGLAACVTLASALLLYPQERTAATLPVRLFFWSAATILVLFAASWYLGDATQQCSPFISSRSLQRF